MSSDILSHNLTYDEMLSYIKDLKEYKIFKHNVLTLFTITKDNVIALYGYTLYTLN